MLLTIYVYEETGSSGLAVGVLFVVMFLPNLVVAPCWAALPDESNHSGRQLRLIRGLRLVARNHLLLSLTVATTLLWFGLSAQESFLIVFVDRVVDAPTSTFAYLITVGAVGGFIGSAVTPRLASDRHRALGVFSGSLVLAGLAFGAFALLGVTVASALVIFLAGVFSCVYLREHRHPSATTNPDSGL